MARRLRRTIAAVVLAGIGLALGAPLALAFGPEKTGLCSRGRCCCPGAPTDGGPCVRTACRCGGDREAAVAAPTIDEGLLPTPVAAGVDDDAGTLATALRSRPHSPDLTPPDHPPPFSLSTR